MLVFFWRFSFVKGSGKNMRLLCKIERSDRWVTFRIKRSESCVCWFLAGVVGHQRLPLRPLLHGLPGGQVVLHQGPARSESFSHLWVVFRLFFQLIWTQPKGEGSLDVNQKGCSCFHFPFLNHNCTGAAQLIQSASFSIITTWTNVAQLECGEESHYVATWSFLI